MASLAKILQEADAIIEKRASVEVKTASVNTPVADDDDEIFKLAQEVRDFRPKLSEPQAGQITTVDSLSDIEKLAFSLAMTEILMSGAELSKLAEFEKQASDQGASPEQIQSYVTQVCEKTGAGQRALVFMDKMGEGLQRNASRYGEG